MKRLCIARARRYVTILLILVVALVVTSYVNIDYSSFLGTNIKYKIRTKTTNWARLKRLRSEHDCQCRANQVVELNRHTKLHQYSVNLLTTGDEVLKTYELTEDEFRGLNLRCGLFSALRRGPRQKVVSYSLYGNKTFYFEKLANLTNQINEKYPGWIMRVYYDGEALNKSKVCEIECSQNSDGQYLDNADFCNVRKMPRELDVVWNAAYIHGAMWRWLPLGDSFVDLLSSRDSDSFILNREAAAVQAWLNSSTLFHVMRDHKAHFTTILAGMWGMAVRDNRNFAKRIYDSFTNRQTAHFYNKNGSSPKGEDQNFLHKYVWPFAVSNMTCHDSYLCKNYQNSMPFPTRRLNPDCFIGWIEWCDETLEVQNLDEKKICPQACRPKEHQEWIYC